MTVRPYQREDIEKLKKHKCMACFNEQRTGKTPTAIRAMVERGLNKVLVVCPASAVYPWAREYTTWSGYPAQVVTGSADKRAKLVKDWTCGALIMSYDIMKSSTLQILLQQDIEGFILDEAHRIKDRKTQNAKAAFALAAKIPYRLALTGTPAPGKPEDIWSILYFLYPQVYQSYWAFIDYYFITRLQYNSAQRRYKEILGLNPKRTLNLLGNINDIATQRKRKEVMEWLPEKDYRRIPLKPTAMQLKYLADLKDYFETETVVTQGVLDRLIRYRQICLAPALLNLKGASPKTDWIKSYLEDYPDQPTIIFSKFTSYLKLLQQALAPKYSFDTIIGDTPVQDRAKIVDKFQRGDTNLLLINIDAGKEALTLDRAEAIIFTDKFPPIGDIMQAEDRFVSTTPDKADKPHIIYELVITGTYDEDIYDLLANRKSATDAINDFAKYMQKG